MSFPLPPDDFPEIIYKYRDWSNEFHKKTLMNMELFSASAASFNDPIDCKIPIAYYKMKDDPELTIKYFEGYVARQPRYRDLTDSERHSKVKTLINMGWFYDPEKTKEKEQEQFKQLAEYYGIISFSKHKANILLWSHYAASHTGYCIGFKSDQLLNNAKRFGNGRKVKYEDEMPTIMPTDDLYDQMINQVYTKSKVWAYEDEYRFTKIVRDLEQTNKNRVIEFTQNEVAEIIIGASMRESEFKSVISICKCNFPETPIFQTIVVPRTFKLAFKQIN